MAVVNTDSSMHTVSPFFVGLGVLGEFADHLALALAVQAFRVGGGELSAALGAEGALLRERVLHRAQQLGGVLARDQAVDKIRAGVGGVCGGKGEPGQFFPSAFFCVYVEGGVAVHALDLRLSDLVVSHPQDAVFVGVVECVHRFMGKAQGAFAVGLGQRQVADHHEQRRLPAEYAVVLFLKPFGKRLVGKDFHIVTPFRSKGKA